MYSWSIPAKMADKISAPPPPLSFPIANVSSTDLASELV